MARLTVVIAIALLALGHAAAQGCPFTQDEANTLDFTPVADKCGAFLGA